MVREIGAPLLGNQSILRPSAYQFGDFTHQANPAWFESLEKILNCRQIVAITGSACFSVVVELSHGS